MRKDKSIKIFDVIILLIAVLIIFIAKPPLFEAALNKSKTEHSEVLTTKETKEKLAITNGVISLIDCKRILDKNSDNKKYTNEEVKLISDLLYQWAKWNAELIIEKD